MSANTSLYILALSILRGSEDLDMVSEISLVILLRAIFSEISLVISLRELPLSREA